MAAAGAGIECTDGHLTVKETADVLRFLAKWANVFVDPKGGRQKVKALDQKSPSA